jgi:hypothetical protein
MGALGKTLVIFNVLAAGAFVYIATLDWGARQAWTEAAFKHELAIKGLPLQRVGSPETVDAGSVPFEFQLSDSTTLHQLKESTLQNSIPPGGTTFGASPSEVVDNQTREVERVRDKVRENINAQDGPELKRRLLLTFLLNLAKTGAERDGINALLRDLYDQRRQADARRELHLLGRTPAQVAALNGLYWLGRFEEEGALQNRELVAVTKKELAQAARALVPASIPATASKEQREEAMRRLNNALTAIVDANGESPDANRIGAAKQALAGAAEGGATELLNAAAEIAGNALTNAEAIADASSRLQKVIVDLAETNPEKEAMQSLIPLLAQPKNANIPELAEKVGRGLLDARFEEAIAQASTAPGGRDMREPDAKAMAIAHLLYHIDAHQPWEERKQWHDRVQKIVGMTNYVRAADAQATALSEMSQRLQAEIKAEDAEFQTDYQALAHRAMFLAAQFDDVQSRLNEQARLEADHTQSLTLRAQEFADLTAQLKAAQADAKKVLAELRKEQGDLYQTNVKLRQTQDNLFNLESQLRAMEERVSRLTAPKTTTGTSTAP